MRVGSTQRGAEHSATERPSSSSVAKKLRKTISRERYLLTSTESSDEDSLFDNTAMGLAGAGRYSRSDYARSQRRENFAGARSASDHWRWKFVCLASAFTFIGLSYALCARLVLNRGGMAASCNGQVVAADEDYHLTPVQHFFNLSALHVGGYLLGLFIVGRLILRTNPFAISLTLMVVTLPATMFCINSIGNDIQHIASTPRWIIPLHALAFGGVERIGLLFSHSRKASHLRWIYAIYAILAIAALLGNSGQTGGKRTSVGQWWANVSVEVRPSPSHHGVFKRDIHLFDDKPALPTPNPIAATPPSNTATATPVAKNVTTNTTIIGQTSTEQPVFKTKTEENAFKRQEAEIKQKLKEGKLKADDTTAATTAPTISPVTTTPSTTSTTPLPTTTISSPTFPPKSLTNVFDGKSARNGTMTTRSEASRSMSDEERAFTNLTATSQQLSNTTASSSFTTMGTAPLYVIIISLLVPTTFGLSCCLLGRPLSADTQLVEAMRLCEQDAGPNEPCSCGILSALLWLLHSSLESLAIAFIPLTAYSDGTAARALNFGLPWELNFATIYWALAVLPRLFFTFRWYQFRPLSATSSKTIHNFYILSILSFAIVHFVLPSYGALRDALTSAIIGLFISVIPLLLYSWQFAQLQTHPLALSRRFLASSAFGKLLLPLIATLTMKWKRDSSTTAGSTMPLAMALIASCYFLFMLLSAVVNRVKRQQQISTLCSDLNGRSSGGGSGGGKKTKTSATNGQYKSLLAEMGADGESSSGTDVELETENAHIV